MLTRNETEELNQILSLAKNGYKLDSFKILWLAEKLKELNDELTEIQYGNESVKIITDAKHRLMKELNISEKVAYSFIVKTAMQARKTKRQIAEELLMKKSLV